MDEQKWLAHKEGLTQVYKQIIADTEASEKRTQAFLKEVDRNSQETKLYLEQMDKFLDYQAKLHAGDPAAKAIKPADAPKPPGVGKPAEKK